MSRKRKTYTADFKATQVFNRKKLARHYRRTLKDMKLLEEALIMRADTLEQLVLLT